eukprot:SAG11_NODE_1085_length_5939_cov_9.908390_8_plen_112_part_00
MICDWESVTVSAHESQQVASFPLSAGIKWLRGGRVYCAPAVDVRIVANTGIDGGKTSDPRQLQLEIAMTAGCCLAALMGFAVYSGNLAIPSVNWACLCQARMIALLLHAIT